jgi:elongation factor G
MHLPIGQESGFTGIIDLVEFKAYLWTGNDLDASFKVVDIPANMLAKADKYRKILVEQVIEGDDYLIEKFLSGLKITNDEVKSCIRKAVLQMSLVPVFCGSAFKNKGVQLLLDAVVDYLPSPSDINQLDANKNIINTTKDKKLKALAFKVMNDPFVGSLTFIRVYAGSLASGDTVYNSAKKKKERIGRMLLMHANNKEDIKKTNI